MKPALGGPILCRIFFANDVFLFGEASKTQAGNIEAILREFCGFSSQKVNIGKLNLYVSQNSNREFELAINVKWGIPLISNLGKYLGFLVIHGRVNKRTYQEVGVKVQRKLSGWRSRFFCKAVEASLLDP